MRHCSVVFLITHTLKFLDVHDLSFFKLINSKLEPHGRLCCYLGYRIAHKGFRYYDPILVACIFLEMSFSGNINSFVLFIKLFYLHLP